MYTKENPQQTFKIPNKQLVMRDLKISFLTHLIDISSTRGNVQKDYYVIGDINNTNSADLVQSDFICE